MEAKVKNAVDVIVTTFLTPVYNPSIERLCTQAHALLRSLPEREREEAYAELRKQLRPHQVTYSK